VTKASSDSRPPLPSDFKKLKPWRMRDEVFDAFCRAQGAGDRHDFFGASYDGEFYGHHRVGALVDYDDSFPSLTNVLVFAFHDENFEEDRVERGVSMLSMLRRSSDVAINDLEQARAVVKALRAAFGDEVLT